VAQKEKGKMWGRPRTPPEELFYTKISKRAKIPQVSDVLRRSLAHNMVGIYPIQPQQLAIMKVIGL
jgi:hypothetical protein